MAVTELYAHLTKNRAQLEPDIREGKSQPLKELSTVNGILQALNKKIFFGENNQINNDYFKRGLVSAYLSKNDALVVTYKIGFKTFV